jgi:hypothetical protein
LKKIKEKERLSRSIFNLNEKPTFPINGLDTKEQTIDRSMMNLYLKEEQKMSLEQNRFARSVFNLYEKPEFPEQKTVTEGATDRSMMGLY